MISVQALSCARPAVRAGPAKVQNKMGQCLPGPSSCPARLSAARLPLRRSQQRAGAVVAQASAEVKAPSLPFRVGHGFDLHRLAPGLRLVLGGIDIPHTKGCEAHSDGDVLIHCMVDAILGALGLPDIGQLFPDNDPTWKGASSDRFLLEAMKRMREAGYEIGNIDSTIIAQKPKLSPHKAAIKTNLCKLMGVSEDVVNIKAKTHEKVDSLGEERSIACHTVVLLIKK